MYDSVQISTAADYLAPDAFSHHRASVDERGTVARHWIPGGAGIDDYLPHVDYWRFENGRDDPGRVKVRFSIPKLLRLDLRENVSDQQKERALDAANNFLADRFGAILPDVRSWSVQRVDYAHNWNVGDLLPMYMALMQNLHIGSYSREGFHPSEGVLWKSRGKGGRWIKFYNKSKLLGDGDPRQTLRFEVSNSGRALAYMFDKWFLCPRILSEALHPGRALYTMAFVWERLGLYSVGTYERDNMILYRLRQCYGKRAPSAFYALAALRLAGNRAYAENGLMSKSMYYAWKDKLLSDGFLVMMRDDDPLTTSASIPALKLPSPQNLKIIEPSPISKNDSQNFWKNLAAGLGVSPELEPIEPLMRDFYGD